MRSVWVSEAARMYFGSLRRKFSGIHRYKGDAEEICHSVVSSCWNKKRRYFQTSAGHFCQFYTRDFAWCTRPLVNIGLQQEVHRTLEYALKGFASRKRITVAISPGGNAFDFPGYAVDSLPCLLHSMVEAEADHLIEKYRDLLHRELKLFCARVLEKSTGLVTPSAFFSSAKDHYQRASSCYDNMMLGMLSADLDRKGFHNPLCEYDYKKLLKFNFWTGSGFIDDLSGKNLISGDANVFPYWSGLFADSSMINSSVKTLRNLKLDYPFPLKYTGNVEGKRSGYAWLAPDYQGNSIWTYLGLLYIDALSKVDRKLALHYLHKYTEVIEKHGNFLEVFDSNGNPYRSRFYYTDDSMLWAVIYLDLVKKLG
jgi:hypothetical protein